MKILIHHLGCDQPMQAFGKKGMNGVMTYLFIKTIKQNPDITYGGILKKMHEEIEKIKMKQCHPKILKRMFRTKIAQVSFHLRLSLLALTFINPKMLFR